MSYQNDKIMVNIAGLIISVHRSTTLSVPHEVTIVIPRIELRCRRYQRGKLAEETEKILNSITIVHSPRHPTHNPKKMFDEQKLHKSSTVTWKYFFRRPYLGKIR